MATAAPVDPGLAAVESSAANALATAMSSDPAPPASSPDPTPSPAPPATAAPATPSTEAPTPAAPPQAPPVGQATAPTTIDTSGLSPEARRFLEMKGGDVDRALKDALDYNNRLAAAARGEAPAPGAPAVPPAPTVPGAAPAAPPAALASPQAPPAAPVAPVDPAAIERELEGLLRSDQECIRLAQAFRTDVDTIQALDAKYGGPDKIEAEIRYHERRLQDADIKDDEVATANIKEAVRELKEVRAERRDIVRNARELDASYNGRAGQYQQHINTRYEGQRAKAESDARVERHAQDLSVSWTPAIQRAATANNISPELIPKFEELARQAALANIELGFAVEDLPEFLNRQAKVLAEVIDIGHRAKSAELGDAVRRRAESPGPAAEASVATAQVPQSDDLKEVYRLTQLRLAGKL